MMRAFLLGILVTLTPSLLVVAWLVWRADVPVANSGRLQGDATTKPDDRSHTKKVASQKVA